MLSVILYGRNDQHGYNYQKRLSISLNCIAEVLTADDEILFVDYNSCDEDPTVIESIEDTLTCKTKSLLRTFRVRSFHHPHQKPYFLLNEPLARNIAIRRSNPKNKWILSTNIDMIFVPLCKDALLSSVISSLSSGFYQLPRFEIPENIWELQFDRLDPKNTIAFLKEHGPSFHLNTTVRREGFLMYDNLGDFQLMLRKDIFAIGAFNEKMTYGWGVDSNLSKRMSFLYPSSEPILEKHLWGYHCAHLRKSSFFHSNHYLENNWNHFVSYLSTPIANQSKNWGLANEEIEEIRFNPHQKQSKDHVVTLGSLLEKEPKEPSDFLLNHSTYNQSIYSSGRIFLHLADHFCHLPMNSTLAYIGNNSKLPQLIQQYFSDRKKSCTFIEMKQLDPSKEVDLFIFDFGFDEIAYQPSRTQLKWVLKLFVKTVKQERKKRKRTKFIAIQATHTDFLSLLIHYLLFSKNSFITGITYGYPKPKRSFHRLFPKYIGIKRRSLLFCHYMLTRYLFDYSYQIRNFLYHNKFSKNIFKR